MYLKIFIYYKQIVTSKSILRAKQIVVKPAAKRLIPGLKQDNIQQQPPKPFQITAVDNKKAARKLLKTSG